MYTFDNSTQNQTKFSVRYRANHRINKKNISRYGISLQMTTIDRTEERSVWINICPVFLCVKESKCLRNPSSIVNKWSIFKYAVDVLEEYAF